MASRVPLMDKSLVSLGTRSRLLYIIIMGAGYFPYNKQAYTWILTFLSAPSIKPWLRQD